jgi:RNA-splicing ligase RtcB
LICVGKGNDDWNQSAPHGAGRLLSRSVALGSLSLRKFQDEMIGIFSTSVSKSTLDESPMAYKTIDEIIKHVTPTVDIVERLRPIYNFKAAEESSLSKREKYRNKKSKSEYFKKRLS